MVNHERSRALHVVLLFLAFALHAVVGFFCLASGLVVPAPVVVLLLVAWLAMLAVLVVRRHQPWVALGVPFVAAALWVVVVQGGSVIFGWTA